MVAIPQAEPSISQVLPQTVAAGAQGVTMTVVGANFSSDAVVLWNGNTLSTSQENGSTLAATVPNGNVASPAVVQLMVQDRKSGHKSNPVNVTITSQSSGSSAGPVSLTIATASLTPGTVGTLYSADLSAAGGTMPYAWSIASGALPAGLTLDRSTGAISGTPSASGTFNFSVQVKDAGSPSQSASASYSMVVNAASNNASSVTGLLLSAATLPEASVGQSYAASLVANGGTAPYAWTVISGGLPTGVTLSPSGVFSGTPSVSGTFSFTVSVTDSGNPAQKATASDSITVQAPSRGGSGGTTTTSGGSSGTTTTSSGSGGTTTTTTSGGSSGTTVTLAITTTWLPQGIDGTAYSTQLQGSGGTPAYTWSISSGSLPAGLTLGASNGIISGTPTGQGTSNFTVAVSDNSSPAETISLGESITVSATAQPTGPGTTWYIRPDGGTRYSSNMTNGQCDGMGDAAYPGTGTNQHCAFNDYRYLYQDGSYSDGSTFPAWGWVIAGGDTVIIRGSIGTGVSYRVGAAPPSQTSYCDANNICWGLAGDPADSFNPPIPGGTASQPTRILGENYAACTNQSARTQLHGGTGLYYVLDLRNTSYVDVQCLDITDFSGCSRAAGTCTSADDTALNGIRLYSNATNITLDDIRVHGLGYSGIGGPPGTGFNANDLVILGNGGAGWNADPGDGTTGVGTMNVTNFVISWNGCAEEYPIVDAVPYQDCRDDSTGGYGDGFGTTTSPSPAPGWQIHFDQGVVSYNTQDGLDALHVNGPGTSVSYTRVLAFGNEGQQLKVGAITNIQNSQIVGNCAAILQTIPGRPATTGDNLGDTCRAANTAVAIVTYPGQPSVFQNNTMITGGAVGVEVEYATSDHGATNILQYNNNVFIGYQNSGNGEYPSPIYSNSDTNMLTNPGASWTNNAYLGQKWTCPQAGESAAVCTDPGLVDETLHAYGYGNMAPASSSSAVVGKGAALPSITLDYNGVTRPNPPSIGALEP
ncbi:hypothetical protein GCM10011507_29860 [Edaphobacter acidisoli]|uniref:Uncharacterized protein n=2 Tax=Edaphobacter acidisoli TaxID=2040573 RepID=A0A916RZ66_9BACT|nr:hypothetical protein GCM10011507_29860 [Edaphobacter acidisoli]